MVDTAVKFEIKQKKILKALLKAFHCNENTRQSTAVVLIASLTTYDIFFEMKLNGSNTSENNNASEVSWLSVNSYIILCLYIKLGGAVASWLVRSTPDRVVRVRGLAGDIVLCPWARHFTLTVPLSTQVYKWVPA